MRSDSTILIDLMKKALNAKNGYPIAYDKDCQLLSEMIRRETRRTVSVSTLKRFFGIIQSPCKPSLFTLDTLSIFLGYQNFADFARASEVGNTTANSCWSLLREQARAITDISLNSLQTKTGSKTNGYPLREFADRKFLAFLDSDRTATAFIAPDGYGKSTIAVQLAYRYFIGQDPLNPEDIFCLIDGGIFI